MTRTSKKQREREREERKTYYFITRSKREEKRENTIFGSYHLIQIPTYCPEFYLVNHFDGKYTQSNDKLPHPSIHASHINVCELRLVPLAIRFGFEKLCVVANSQ